MPDLSAENRLPEALTTAAHMAWFFQNRGEIASRVDVETLNKWMNQVTWLGIVQAFEDNPDLEAVAVELEVFNSQWVVFANTRRHGQDQFFSFGEDPDELDKTIQERLGRVAKDHGVSMLLATLDGATLRRNNLEEMGAKALGYAWVARRKADLLDQSLKGAEDASARCRPRL